MDYPKPIANLEELPQQYGGLEREKFWQQYWMDCGVYRFDPTKERGEIFSVDTPPPTVSGALHIGHVYSYTQTDMNVRYQRMRGKHVFYPFGFDDNGLPTERLVERERGIRAHEVGREKFIEECRPIVEAAEAEFIALWQSLALSCDWSQFYTTISEKSRAISQASFIDLYNKGIVYRREAPTQWCWADQTAIAQAEIEDREVPGHFHEITFHIDNDGELIPVTIATTRPELIPACVAVLAHPDDERYKHLFGKKAITPLFEVEVPVLPSEKADPEKGTGILMCCTFGDQEDVEHWELYKLPTRVIIGEDGRIVEFADKYYDAADFTDSDLAVPMNPTTRFGLSTQWPSRNQEVANKFAIELQGLKIKQARTRIVELLKDAGLLGNVRDIVHVVRHSERGGVPIEILVTQQWYVNLLDHKQQLIEQGRRVNWHPPHMFKRFENWVENLNADWCISRQRYNGVPFPAWYDRDGNIVIAEHAQLPVNPLVDKPRADGEFTPDTDVMDTWATSSVTPLLNTEYDFSKSLADNAKHNKLFPFDLRPQAHDIIRTWAFYTIAKAYFHFGEIPWKDIVISGHAQSADRSKISKSKGHGVSPAQMVEQYTADNLRYWSGSPKLGTDTIYDEKSLGEGRKLINKLFNATKFALRHLVDFDPTKYGTAPAGTVGPRYDTDALLKLVTFPTDRWMLRELQHAEERATKAQDAFEFGDALNAAEEFFWAVFCDNYLELSKGRLYGEELFAREHPGSTAAELKQSAQAALFIALSVVLRMFAPVLPHITEECWSWYHAQWSFGRSIHEQPWPTYDRHVADASDERSGKLLVEILATVRKWKSQANVSIKKPVAELVIYNCGDAEHPLGTAAIAPIIGDLLSTTNSRSLTIRDGKGPEGEAYIEGYAFSVDCVLAEEEEG